MAEITTDLSCASDEEWKPIEECDDYEVSDHGRVRSWLLRGSTIGTRRTAPIIRKLICNNRGYLQVSLCLHGKTYTKNVHRLVLIAFRGAPPDGCESRHLNGNQRDNRLVNLTWGTSAENMNDQRTHGTLAVGSRHGRSKLTEQQVLKIRNSYCQGGVTQADLAREYGVNHVTICDIVNRKTWQHV